MISCADYEYLLKPETPTPSDDQFVVIGEHMRLCEKHRPKPMISCKVINNNILDGGKLSEEEIGILTEHLRECSLCEADTRVITLRTEWTLGLLHVPT